MNNESTKRISDSPQEKDVDTASASGKVKKLLIYLGIAAGLTALAFVAVAVVIRPMLVPAESTAKASKSYMFPFETLVVNPAETDGARFLKVTLHAEFASKELIDKLEKKTPQLRNTLIMILSSKTIEQISDTTGKESLRQEIVDKLNADLDTGEIENVYFAEFVIQ